MSMLTKSARVAFYALMACVLLACGGKGNNANNTPASIRLVNATTSTPTSVVFNGTAYLSGVPASSASAYANITGGTYTMSVVATDGGLSTFNAQSISFGAGDFYTSVAYQRNGGLQSITFPDNQATPATGFTALRVANASTDPGALDIYLTAVGATLTTGVSPTLSFVGGGSLTTSLSIVSGTYQIIVTGFGNQSDVRLVIPSVPLASQQILTMVLTTTPGGALVNGVLVVQGLAPSFYPNTNARMRLVAGIPGTGTTNSSVGATVGADTIPAIQSPTVGQYMLVPSGTVAFGVTVGGVAVPGLTTIGPAAGGDYTILVYGTAAAPSVALLTDDNQATAVSGDSNLRLVNAAVPDGALSMSVNFQTVAANVTYGTSSGYSGVPSSSTALVQVTSPLATFPPYTANGVDLISEGVYTLFVLGSETAPIEILNKDR
jgi:hypothetical protein